MLRMLAAFVVIFALLSLMVELLGLFEFFAGVAVALICIDLAAQQLSTRVKPAKVRRQSLVV